MHKKSVSSCLQNGPGEPYFSIVRTDSQPNGNLALSVGLPATYLMTIKTLPQARADYTVTVTAANGLSVCLVRVKEVGWNMPCVDSELEANYTQYADSHYSDTGKLIFGPITNVGMYDQFYFLYFPNYQY